MDARPHATESPPPLIVAYLTPYRYPPQWRAHPASNSKGLTEAPTMEEAIEEVRRRFTLFERAAVVLLDDQAHEYVVRRAGWSEAFGYYAGVAPSVWGQVQMLWQDPQHAKRMGVAQAYATAAAVLESVVVEAWPRTGASARRPSEPSPRADRASSPFDNPWGP